jgi:hypothetical protein
MALVAGSIAEQERMFRQELLKLTTERTSEKGEEVGECL